MKEKVLCALCGEESKESLCEKCIFLADCQCGLEKL